MIEFICKILRGLGAIVLSALLLVVVLVIVDTKLKLGASWASELSSFLLGWTVMIGGALAYAEKRHLGLDILVERFDQPTHDAAIRLGHLIIFCFGLAVMSYGGFTLAAQRFDMGQLMPSLGIARAWFYVSIPFAGVLVTVTALGHLVSPITPHTEES